MDYFECGLKEGIMYGWSINSYKWISLYDLVWLIELIFCMMEIVSGKEKNVNGDGCMIYILRWCGRGGIFRVYGVIVR